MNKRNRPPEYAIWYAMIQRCYKPTHPKFKIYGARGITVCNTWRTSFQVFLQDMGRRPDATYSLDRIDNNGNYEPENCRWATRWEQQRNRRDNHLVTFNNETFCIAEWSTRFGQIPSATVYDRIRAGWPPKRLFDPVRPYTRRSK